MSRRRYQGVSPVELELLSEEQRREIRRLALIKSAEASTKGHMRHALTKEEIKDLNRLDGVKGTPRRTRWRA